MKEVFIMKIITQGVVEREIKKFECDYCGCVFEAEPGEYGSDNQYYSCKCPTCGRMVIIG